MHTYYINCVCGGSLERLLLSLHWVQAFEFLDDQSVAATLASEVVPLALEIRACASLKTRNGVSSWKANLCWFERLYKERIKSSSCLVTPQEYRLSLSSRASH